MPEDICSINDCLRPAKSRGWCGTHYSRWQRTGGMAARPCLHRLSEIDPETRRGVCEICGPTRVKSNGRNRGWRCQKAAKQWKQSGKSHKWWVEAGTKERLLAAQGGRCGICNESIEGPAACLDHCHRTRKPRGVLCRLCNSGLGFFGDSEERLVAAHVYLQNATGPL